MISFAQGRCSFGEAGVQVKIRLRTGVSETPTVVSGPPTTKSRMCGSEFTP